ncbi:unnamed protein product [Amoebophrya sp. A25]|nr:unnamed protein product [Amoebophrya sp. A25]|eukprot:GSA25T00001732001.1
MSGLLAMAVKKKVSDAAPAAATKQAVEDAGGTENLDATEDVLAQAEGAELTPAQKRAQERQDKEEKLKAKSRSFIAETIDDIMEGFAECYRVTTGTIEETSAMASRTIYPIKEYLIGTRTTQFVVPETSTMIEETTFEMK